jgi:2,3-dihydro-2,3-dihydroxybenzoate dehydrogenase
MPTVLITGARAGLGALIAEHLAARAGFTVIPFDIKDGCDVRDPTLTYGPAPDVDILINCAGVNRTGWLEDYAEEDWDAVMDINAKGIFIMSQWLLESLKIRRGTILNIVSNASHMPMTTSLAYNASKGAAHIMTLQLARELTKRYGITVFGISPNKLAGTEMSRDIEEQVLATRGWTAEYARQYQLNALLTGEETDPDQLAEFISFLLSRKERHKFLSGCVLPYGA